jgi:hypothetical protein
MLVETLAMKAFTIRSQDPEKQKAKDESHEIIKKGIAKDVRSHLCTSLHVSFFLVLYACTPGLTLHDDGVVVVMTRLARVCHALADGPPLDRGRQMLPPCPPR